MTMQAVPSSIRRIGWGELSFMSAMKLAVDWNQKLPRQFRDKQRVVLEQNPFGKRPGACAIDPRHGPARSLLCRIKFRAILATNETRYRRVLVSAKLLVIGVGS